MPTQEFTTEARMEVDSKGSPFFITETSEADGAYRKRYYGEEEAGPSIRRSRRIHLLASLGAAALGTVATIPGIEAMTGRASILDLAAIVTPLAAGVWGFYREVTMASERDNELRAVMNVRRNAPQQPQ